MLLAPENLFRTCATAVIITLVVYICARYAYRVNERRPEDDPHKLKVKKSAVSLAVLTWPFIPFAFIMIFVLRVLFYLIFLCLFTIALLAFRKPFLFAWLEKTATKIGNRLLELNTFLINAFLGRKPESP